MSTVAAMLQERVEQSLLHTQFGSHDGQIGKRGPFGTSKFADAIDGVVVIEEQEELPAGLEGIGLTYQLQCMAGIGAEDARVFVRGSMKKVQHTGTRPFDQFSHGPRGWIERVRIAKDIAAQQFKVLAQLAFGIESTPRIIKIDLSQIVQPCVLSCP